MAPAEGQQASGEDDCLDRVSHLDQTGDHFNLSPPGRVTPSQEIGLMSPPPKPETSASRAGNRLSLSLPVLAGERDVTWLIKHAPTDSNPSTRQASPSRDVDQKLSSTSSNEFLVALAAQERRVFELKEELHRAESKLKDLKMQWAIHESRRNIIRPDVESKQIELRQIQPIVSGIDSPTDGEEEDNKTTRRSLNMDPDRRKALLASSSKESRRKIISGGHTRALSLLSPVQGSYGQTASVPQMANVSKERLTNGLVSPDASQTAPLTGSKKARNSYQGSATIGVKQIAEDIKSGLWTFMEDLRQATVGEEAVKAVSAEDANLAPRRSGKKSSRGTSMPADQGLGQSPQEEPSLLKLHNGDCSRPAVPIDAQDSGEIAKIVAHTPSATKKKEETASSLDEEWPNWDSPASKEESGRWSNSTAISQDASYGFSPSNEVKSEQTTTSSSDASKDELAWSALNSFAPSNIKRTASAIIKEWENSLTPPPHQDQHKGSVSRFPNLAKKGMDEESRLLLNNLP